MDPALIVAGTLTGVRLNAEYADKLTADLTEDQKVAQPAPGMNHPGWLLSHLNLYLPMAIAVARGQTPPDPRETPDSRRYGYGSEVSPDPSAYAPLADLRRAFADGHVEAEAALRSATLDALSAPPPVERWRERFGTVAEMLNYQLVRHETLHLGQLSAWRRAMGLPRV